MADCARSMLRSEWRVKVCTTISHLELVDSRRVMMNQEQAEIDE